MRNLVAVASIALLTLAFAGCADDPERYPDGVPSASSSRTSATGTSSSTSATGTTTTSTNGPGGNQAPTGTLGVHANGTTVEVKVTGSDADGDDLTWTVSFGDGNSTNGTALPSEFNHTYAAGAVYNLTYVLSDGELDSNYTASVNTTAAAATIPQPYTFTGTAVGAHEPGLTGAGTGDNVVHTFAVTGPVKTLHALLTWEPAAAGTDLDLYIDDSTGTERGRSACANLQPAPADPIASCNRGADEETTIEGLAGAAETGDWSATIVPFEAPNLTYTLVIDFT